MAQNRLFALEVKIEDKTAWRPSARRSGLGRYGFFRVMKTSVQSRSLNGKIVSMIEPIRGSQIVADRLNLAPDRHSLIQKSEGLMTRIAPIRAHSPITTGALMNSNIDLTHCLSFINCQLNPAATPVRVTSVTYRAVTISREAGAGGRTLAEKLVQLLQSTEPQPARPWTIFDRNLVEMVLKDHDLPARLARFMPEDHVSEMSDTLDELFGLHPPSWELVRKTAETILGLAALGNVILIGRGANVITNRMDHVFHVRLVGSPETRVKRLQELDGSGHEAALRRAEKEDLARRRY